LSGLDAVATRLFGCLHLLARFPKQVVEVDFGLEQDNSYADAERPNRSSGLEMGFGCGMPYAFRNFFGLILSGTWQKHSEFVTSNAADQIATSDRRANDSCDESQRLVSGAMADALIQPFQVINVYHKKRPELSPRSRPRQRWKSIDHR
jgi:hypothetical protein